MKALVTGISGQDGHYMTRLLLDRGFEVVGLTSTSAKADDIAREFADDALETIHFDYQPVGAINEVIDQARPDLIFNFAAKSTGSGMFAQPFEMARLNGGFVLDILEAIRAIDPAIAFCQASSAEMYGVSESCPQSELTAFRPQSPYGAAKLYAHNLIGIYRAAFNLRCSSAILYNHESVRRSPAFVTRKIAQAAASIKLGVENKLRLGAIDSQRDWGHAKEYVEAMYLMATAAKPRDYVVATGRLTSIERVCEICFGYLGLDHRDYLELDGSLTRAIHTTNVCGDASAIYNELGWKAAVGIDEILIEMVDFDLARLQEVGASSS